MIKIELTDPEKELLAHILESYLRDLSGEISHTDRLEVRERLKDQRTVLNKVLEALGKEPA